MQEKNINIPYEINEKSNIDLLFNFRQHYLLEPFPYIDYSAFVHKYKDNKITLPYLNLDINIDNKLAIDWNLMSFESGKNSALLWLHSLSMIYYLCKASKIDTSTDYIEQAIEIYKSWNSWCKLSSNNRLFTFEQEHAVSNRLAVFLFLNDVILEYSIDVEDVLKVLLLQDILEHIDWLSKDQYYVQNNHGLMMDMSLLAGANKFAKCFDIVKYSNLAMSRALALFKSQFDKDGCCTENSPEYHILNLKLYKALHAMCISFEINDSEITKIVSMLHKAEEVSGYMIREDGKTPPIGDSEVQHHGDIKHNYGAVCYSESGFGIVKTNDCYFSIKCGGMSFVHKHVDDTSITYRYKGLDIIVDGGRFSYDTTDRRRRDAMSFRSHSGFFTNDFEGYLFKNFSTDDLRTKTDLTLSESAKNVFKFSAINNMIGNLKIERKVSVFDKELLIEDIGMSNIEKTWYSQFLLHPDAEIIDIRDGNVYCNIYEINFVIKHNSTNKFEVLVEKRLYSELFMNSGFCNIVIFKSVSHILNSFTAVVVL